MHVAFYVAVNKIMQHLSCPFTLTSLSPPPTQRTQDQAYAEQVTIRGEELPLLEYDQLKHLEFLDRCLKETLRLRPPIMTMMRMVKTPQVKLYMSIQVNIHVYGIVVKAL